MMRVLLRIITGFLSAYSLILFGSMFWRHLNEKFWIIVLSVWVVAWAVLEIVTACRKHNVSRLLTHLRYGPIATFLLFLITLFAYDEAMVLLSKWKIRSCVYGSASSECSTALKLHNTDRGWCGNGRSAAIYALYADTAAEGFESRDPSVRVRSLRMSIRVYDWINGARDGPFPELISRAGNDPDPLVRKIAADFRREAYGFGDER